MQRREDMIIVQHHNNFLYAEGANEYMFRKVW